MNDQTPPKRSTIGASAAEYERQFVTDKLRDLDAAAAAAVERAKLRAGIQPGEFTPAEEVEVRLHVAESTVRSDAERIRALYERIAELEAELAEVRAERARKC